MQKDTDNIQKKKERLLAKIQQLEKKIAKAGRWDHLKKKKREDRRRFLTGLYFFEKMTKAGEEQKMIALMDRWLKEDRDREIWGLETSGEKDFFHDPERIENRKRYHIGSYFLNEYRKENGLKELGKLIEHLLKNPLDKLLFFGE